MINKLFEELISELNNLPTFTYGTAEKLAFELMNNKSKVIKTINNVNELLTKLVIDQETEQIVKQDEIANEFRSNETLYLFLNNKEANKVLAKTNNNNAYFIINLDLKHDLTDLKKINLFLNRLINYIKKISTKKIFLFLSPSLQSELIFNLIQQELNNHQELNLTISRPLPGIPYDVGLNYLDEKTLKEIIKIYG